ncbi:MAG: hypothetical protein H6Q43_2240, partial [Deltaproteobacteria bacterium]|nr:hypothetical protein [Deltaproteobacteria bacterium]
TRRIVMARRRVCTARAAPSRPERSRAASILSCWLRISSHWSAGCESTSMTSRPEYEGINSALDSFEWLRRKGRPPFLAIQRFLSPFSRLLFIRRRMTGAAPQVLPKWFHMEPLSLYYRRCKRKYCLNRWRAFPPQSPSPISSCLSRRQREAP